MSAWVSSFCPFYLSVVATFVDTVVFPEQCSALPNSDYVILTAFPRQQWLLNRASMLRCTAIACLVIAGIECVHCAVRTKSLHVSRVGISLQSVKRNSTTAVRNYDRNKAVSANHFIS